MPDDQFPHAAPRHQDVADKLLGRQCRQRRVELQHQRVPDTAGRHHRPALHLGGEPEGRPIGPDHLDRMRVEGDDDTGASCRFGASRRLAEHGVMGAVHSVEGADGDGGAFGPRAELTHQSQSAVGVGVRRQA